MDFTQDELAERKTHIKKLNDEAYEKSREGDYKAVKDLIEQGANDFNKIAEAGAYYGHEEITMLAIKHGANNFNKVAESAAFYGHEEIIMLAIRHGADDFNEMAGKAAYGGRKETVEMMLGIGANDFNKIADSAARGGHKDIVELAIEKGADDFNRIAESISSIIWHIRREIDIDNDAFDEIEFSARSEKYQDILGLAIEHGADNFNDYPYLSASSSETKQNLGGNFAGTASESPTPDAEVRNPAAKARNT